MHATIRKGYHAWYKDTYPDSRPTFAEQQRVRVMANPPLPLISDLAYPVQSTRADVTERIPGRFLDVTDIMVTKAEVAPGYDAWFAEQGLGQQMIHDRDIVRMELTPLPFVEDEYYEVRGPEFSITQWKAQIPGRFLRGVTVFGDA